jgi:ribosomal protein S18 acetylase RimI-like enzyme
MIRSESGGAARIRPYGPADRAAVRHLACDTADMGRPFGDGFDAREFLADLLTRYYTDHAPDWMWVACTDDTLAGYVCAAPDERAFQRILRHHVMPALARQVVFGDEFRRPSNRRFLARQVWDWLRHGRATQVDKARFPAHLHLNLAPDFRGRGLGRTLLQTCLAALARAGVVGVRASVRDDNAGAQAFFRRMGFQPLGTGWAVSPAPGLRRRSILMGLVLSGQPASEGMRHV